MRIACYIPCTTTFNQVRMALETACLNCTRFPHESALLIALRRQCFDLILVDTEHVNASLISAWLGCRTGESTPLILLSQSCGADEIAHALNSGVEDFIRRPVAPVELIARVHAVLRRYRKAEPSQLLQLRGFSLDRITSALFDRGVRIDLTPREFALAWLFFSSIGSYLSRKTLSAMVWGVDEEISRHTIEQHVYLLRKKLKLNPARGVQLRTAYNKGYRLEPVGDFAIAGRPDDAISQPDAPMPHMHMATSDLPPMDAFGEPHAENANRPVHLATLPMRPDSDKSRHYKRCSHPPCRRPFQVNRFSGTTCDWVGAGKITCPHCGTGTAADADFIYLAHAMSTEEESRYVAPDQIEGSAKASSVA
jgi:DNA-binding response OmpR family regulator